MSLGPACSNIHGSNTKKPFPSLDTTAARPSLRACRLQHYNGPCQVPDHVECSERTKKMKAQVGPARFHRTPMPPTSSRNRLQNAASSPQNEPDPRNHRQPMAKSETRGDIVSSITLIGMEPKGCYARASLFQPSTCL